MRRFFSALLLLIGASCDLAPKRPSPPTEAYNARPTGLLQLAPGASAELKTPGRIYTLANAESAVLVWRGERFLGGVDLKGFVDREGALNSSPEDPPVFSDGTLHIVFVWRSDIGKMTLGIVFSGPLYPPNASRVLPAPLPQSRSQS